MTTSCGPDAHEPEVRVIGLKRGCAGSTPKPKLAAPPRPPSALPFRSTSLMSANRKPPVAAATLGRAFTFGRSDAGTVGLLAEFATIFLPEMTTLVFSYELVRTPSKP